MMVVRISFWVVVFVTDFFLLKSALAAAAKEQTTTPTMALALRRARPNQSVARCASDGRRAASRLTQGKLKKQKYSKLIESYGCKGSGGEGGEDIGGSDEDKEGYKGQV